MGEWKKTQCNMCAVSCGLEMEVENNRIINVRPDPDSPRSKGYCCRKGRAAKYYVDNVDRLDYPLKRVGDEFVRISWEQAFKEIGEKANAILKEYGPRTFALCGGALGSGQSNLAIAKPFLSAIGSQYIYNPIGVEFMGNWWSHGKILGDQNFYTEPDEKESEVLIFWGSNSYVAHNFNESRRTIREFSENPDKMIIVVDPRLSETARMSDMHIAPRPGTDSLLLRAMIAIILEKGWQDQKYINKWVSDFETVKPWFNGFDIQEALRVCQVPYKQIEDFCRILTTRKWGMHQDLGLFFGRHNTLNSYLAIILMVVCGKLLTPGGNIVMDEYTNKGETIHEEDPKIWRTLETGRFPVLGVYPEGVLPAEIMSKNPEHLRVLFASQTNPARSFPDSKAQEEALSNLDLLVCIDVCMTETARLADYVLPGKTGYEGYEFNLFQVTYPEITCQLKHPVIEQIGERKEDAEIWLGIADAMGLIPELPDSLYQAAEEAVATNDRIPYFFKLIMYVVKHREYFNVLVLIIAKTMGKAMGSATRAIMWAALMISPLAGTGKIERAGIKPRDNHNVLQHIPKLKGLCLMDDVFQVVDDHPEGAIIGISERNKNIEEHIAHKDKKLHLYCDEINEYIKKITPDNEKAALCNEQFPMILSAGRHSDDGHNATMRNPDTYKYRQPYALAMNPEDAAEMGIEEGQSVRVTTKAGSLIIPVEYTYQTARGYLLIPHHFGFKFNGKTNGVGVNELTKAEDIDEMTGNPTFRFVPCRVEAVSEV